jgi:hypothetical protein
MTMEWGGVSFSVQVVLDLAKPLSRGRTITLRNKTYWVPFQYEKSLSIVLSVVLLGMAQGDVLGLEFNGQTEEMWSRNLGLG